MVTLTCLHGTWINGEYGKPFTYSDDEARAACNRHYDQLGCMPTVHYSLSTRRDYGKD